MATHEVPVGIVVCDAGPLIHLAELDCLDLLGDFNEVLVPDAVWHEVMKHRPSALDRSELNLIRVAPSHARVNPVLRGLTETMNLHRGEQEALSLAVKHPEALMLTDDTAARLAAGSMGIEVHGTIGLLVRSIRCGQRTKAQALELLRAIPEKSTLHLKRSLLEDIIRQVEREAR